MTIGREIVAFKEEEISLKNLKHYTSFCSRTVMHDLGSSDSSKAIAQAYVVKIVDWDSGNQVNDIVNKKIKETCWQGTDADWVICADADELIYFPDGHKEAFESYTAQNIPIVKPHGWEMTSEAMPTTAG